MGKTTSLNADIRIDIDVHTRDLEKQLRDFLGLVQNRPGIRVIRKSAEELDPKVAGLLRSLPTSLFWHALLRLEDFGSSLKKGAARFHLEFSSVDYPYVNVFVKQFENWMCAIGAHPVDRSVTYNFSLATGTNVLNIGREYREGTLAVFLGAGVSTEFRLPMWPELRERMIEDWAGKNARNRERADGLRRCPGLEQARWLKDELGPDFVQSVKQALYRDLYDDSSKVPVSPIVKSLAKMKRLRAICTYNFDDLLERQAGRRFKAIACSRDGYRAGEIPVYHVHGLLPYMDVPRGKLVLSEDEFQALTRDHLDWANVVQINLLRECTCLLIGLSCTDDSLRWLLDTVKNEKAGATYTVQRMEILNEADRVTIAAWSRTKEFDGERFKSLGLRTIWINDFDEIPSILEDCVKH